MIYFLCIISKSLEKRQASTCWNPTVELIFLVKMIKSLVGSLATLTVAYAQKPGPPKNPISHSQWMESLTMTASNQSEIIWYQAKSSQFNEEVIKADGVNNIQLQFLEFDMGSNDDGSAAEYNFVLVNFDGQGNMFQGNYSTGLLWTGVAQGDVTIITIYDQNANSLAELQTWTNKTTFSLRFSFCSSQYVRFVFPFRFKSRQFFRNFATYSIHR